MKAAICILDEVNSGVPKGPCRRQAKRLEGADFIGAAAAGGIGRMPERVIGIDALRTQPQRGLKTKPKTIRAGQDRDIARVDVHRSGKGDVIENRSAYIAIGLHAERHSARQRTAADVGDKDGLKGAIAKAQELVAEVPGSWMPQQFENPANPEIHERTTGKEIWDDTGGRVDVLVAGVGTGGTITGVTRYIRAKNRNFRAIAVEPTDSPVISGGKPGPHKIQGIGAGFVPKNLDVSLLSGVETISNEDAFTLARRLAAEEGILGGISTGANVAAAVRLAAKPENRGKVIVTIAASFGERYLSTPLYQDNSDR